MKKEAKYLCLAVLFVVLLAFASVGYKSLSQQYVPDSMTLPQAGENAQQGSSVLITGLEEQETESGDTETMTAPDFTVYDMDGNAVKLSDHFGKPIIVNFWATWCGPCKSEMPAFDRMYEKYGEDVTFMMVNLTDGVRDTIENVTEFVQEGGFTFPVYFDTTQEAAYVYGTYSIPMTIFVDDEGNHVYTQTGAMSEEILDAYVNILLEISEEGTVR